MSEELSQKRVAALVANEGVEQVELTQPVEALRDAGATVDLIAPETGTVQGFNHLDKGDLFGVDRTVAEISPGEYDAVLLPGGVANPDHLRQVDEAVAFVREMFEAGKPIGAICHAPWMLVEAGVLGGRSLTSYPSLRTDILNAGGVWEDMEVCVDRGLVTSRKPSDLDAFCDKLVEEVAEGAHAR